MPTVSLKVTASDRELWVSAAEGEGVSLSEWLRRAAVTRLGSAAAGNAFPTGTSPVAAEPGRIGLDPPPADPQVGAGPAPLEPGGVGEETEATVPELRRASTPSHTEVGEQAKATAPTGETGKDTSDPAPVPSAPSAPTSVDQQTEDALARARELLGAPQKEFRPDFKQPKAPKKKR